MIITVSGVVIRTNVEGISVTGRNTQGVTLIRVNEGEEVATVARVNIDDEEDEGEDQDIPLEDELDSDDVESEE